MPPFEWNSSFLPTATSTSGFYQQFPISILAHLCILLSTRWHCWTRPMTPSVAKILKWNSTCFRIATYWALSLCWRNAGCRILIARFSLVLSVWILWLLRCRLRFEWRCIIWFLVWAILCCSLLIDWFKIDWNFPTFYFIIPLIHLETMNHALWWASNMINSIWK